MVADNKEHSAQGESREESTSRAVILRLYDHEDDLMYMALVNVPMHVPDWWPLNMPLGGKMVISAV